MRKSAIPVALVFVLIVFAATADAQKDRFIGSFVAEDPNTSGITRLMLFDDDTVNVWGRCHPTDCDWGEEAAVTYAPGAGADLRGTAKAVSAIYVKRHAVTVLIIKPMKEDKLSVDVFTRFTDGTGRTAYTAKYVLVRENAAPAQ